MKTTLPQPSSHHLAPASTQARQVLTLAKVNRWHFRILGHGDMIQEPVYTGDWWLVPVEQDNSIVPASAAKKARAIVHHVPVQGFVIAHEAPKILGVEKEPWQPPDIPWEKLGKVIVFTVGTTVKVMGLAALAMAYLLGHAMLIDPCLIAVLDDGTWIEVERWDE